MSEWRPIDTAPRDGRRVLLAFEGEAHIGFLGQNRQVWLIPNIGPVDVLHWMPLPDVPKPPVDPASCPHNWTLDFQRRGKMCGACKAFELIDESVWERALL